MAETSSLTPRRLCLQVQSLGCSRQWKFFSLTGAVPMLFLKKIPVFPCSWASAVPCRFKLTLNQCWLEAVSARRVSDLEWMFSKHKGTSVPAQGYPYKQLSARAGQNLFCFLTLGAGIFWRISSSKCGKGEKLLQTVFGRNPAKIKYHMFCAMSSYINDSFTRTQLGSTSSIWIAQSYANIFMWIF